MGNGLNAWFWGLILTLTVSCGAGTNPSNKSVYGSALLERQCRTSTVSQETVTVELAGMYNNFLTNYPLSYFIIPEKLYDYKSPLVINLKDLRLKLDQLKEQMADEEYLQGNLTTLALEVYFLYQNALRFEGAKCQLRYLGSKKSQDITPYMSMKDFCADKNSDKTEICTLDSLLNLSPEEAGFVKSNTVMMCGVLTGKTASCHEQFSSEIVSETQRRFRDEHFNKLFTLKDTHLKFSCQKAEEITIMTVQVLSVGWELDKLKALTTYVSEAWSKKNFQLNLEIVDTKTDNVIQIIPTTKPVSYVVDNDNHQVFLSQLIDSGTQKRVMAHEFGHVLGFPDCYTEFYDKDKKSIIYYEISKDNTNIMCSLKTGVSVPAEYLEQLTQKSCLFK